MILPLSLRTTLQHRHWKINHYIQNSGGFQPLSLTAASSSCGTKVWLLSDQSISSLIVSRSQPESNKPLLLSHKETKQPRQRALQASNTWRHKLSLLGGRSELAFCSRASGPTPLLISCPGNSNSPGLNVKKCLQCEGDKIKAPKLKSSALRAPPLTSHCGWVPSSGNGCECHLSYIRPCRWNPHCGSLPGGSRS